MVDAYGYYRQGLLDEGVELPQVSGTDFLRGAKYAPFDLLGAPVDLANMALSPLGLGSDMPVGGSDYLINKYADLGDLLGVNYDRPTGSGSELLGRIASGILAPTAGAQTVGRVVQGFGNYAAGAPARVADRARSVTLGSGIDPTAALDDLIVRGMGDNGGPPMAPEAPVRDVDDLGFYSQALETAQGLKQKKGTGQQFEAMLLKGGVKPDEIAFTPGLRGLLDQPQVTQEELVGLLRAERIRPEETVFYGGDSGFSSLNFPDRPEVLSAEDAYGSNYLDEQAADILDYDLDSVLSIVEAENPGKYVTAEGDQGLAQIKKSIEERNFDDLDVDVQRDVLDAADAIVRERYSYDPVVRLQDPDTGYEIVGSDDMGYSIRDEGGQFIDLGNNIPYSLSEARIQAETNAIDRGIIDYGGGETRFSEYTEDGGTNYRETLLQVPEYEGRVDDFYETAHFDEPNIAVHTRTTDRKMAKDAGDVLYVEELQSDWGQQGRKYGFDTAKDKAKKEEIKKAVVPVQEKLNKVVDERDEFYLNFINSVAEKVGGKKMTQADIDYGRFGVAIETEDGSELLSRAEMNSLLRGTDQVALTSDGRELAIDPSDFDGVDIATKMSDYDFRIRSARQELDDVSKTFTADTPMGPFVGSSEKFAEVGIKRLLSKAVEEGKGYVSFSPGEVQLDRWGNEGLETFYNNIIPKAAKKVVKKLDKEAGVGPMKVRMDGPYDTAERLTIEITPKMREEIKKGIPLFSAGAAGLLGAGMAREEQPQPAGGIL
jgi:hypothetical protein